MNFKKQILVLVITMLMPFALFAEEAVGGSIAVIDVEAAILSTEASKQAFEELSTSKEWKEVDEDLQLKINEAKDIQEKLQKEGPTMSDEDKLDAQKRLNSLSQDANFLNTKLTTMRNELVGLLQNEQAPMGGAFLVAKYAPSNTGVETKPATQTAPAESGETK